MADGEWAVPLVRLRALPEASGLDVIFDMETNDPDDYLTLYLYCTRVSLCGCAH